MHEKTKFFLYINVYNVKYVLSGTYFCPIFENQAVPTKKVTKKQEPVNLNLAESSEVKSLAFPVSLC